ncbi:hypothetical protein I5U65_07930 [Stenotrophomonas maltophilia]|nr:hypothetical protein [Stenotrophomonas maltophilia]
MQLFDRSQKVVATLEKDLAELLRTALAWAQDHADPLPRALARDYLQAEGEAQVATVLRDQTAAELKQARRDRHDARYYRDKGQAGLKGVGKLAERLGWTPKSLRARCRLAAAAPGQTRCPARSASPCHGQ